MTNERLRVVDGLRAFAIVAVVLFHGFPSLVRGGFVGVDIFFVISGFVIALTYLEDMVAGDTSFAVFFLRRIRRLVPAYLVVLAVTTAFAAWLLTPEYLVNYGVSLFCQMFYAQNVAFWAIGDYFDNALTKPLLHTWSLAVEEQFYLLFPLLVLLVRAHRRVALVLLFAAMLASFALGWEAGHISPKTAFYWMPFRVWEFGCGIFAAIWFARGGGGACRPVCKRPRWPWASPRSWWRRWHSTSTRFFPAPRPRSRWRAPLRSAFSKEGPRLPSPCCSPTRWRSTRAGYRTAGTCGIGRHWRFTSSSKAGLRRSAPHWHALLQDTRSARCRITGSSDGQSAHRSSSRRVALLRS